jgi:hypothetical protein
LWKEAWPSLRISSLEDSLSALEALVRRVGKSTDDESAGALTRFLVVRSCGFLEQVTEECCRSYLLSKAEKRAAGFGGSWLGQGRGPHPEQLMALAGRFDSQWADELRQLLDDNDQKLRREVSFLVDRRNKIAHGLSDGLGTRKALDLSQHAREVADWFILRLDPR